MPNFYKQQDVATQSWRRASRVTVENEYNQVPCINFTEEEVMIVNNQKVILKGELLKADMSDPNVTFPLLHPETDQVIGEASYMNIYIMLYSLYKKLALERDASQVS